MKFVQCVQSFVRQEDGAAAIEYGLIAALIAVAIIVGATLLHLQLRFDMGAEPACTSP